MPKDAAELKKLRSQLFDGIFADFHRFRRDDWQPLVRGQLEPEVEDTLTAFAHRYAVQSPELEHEEAQRTRYLMLNDAKVDVVPLQEGDTAAKTCEDIRIALAARLARWNHGRVMDQGWANHTNVLGVSVFRMLWKMPEEPEIEYKADMPYSSYEKRRNQAYLDQAEDCVTVKQCNPLTMAWWPLAKPKDVLEDSVVEYAEWRSLKNKQGEYVGVTSDLKQIEFLGEPQSVDDDKTTGKKLHFVVWEYCDDAGKWWHIEHVYPDGGTLMENGQELDRFEVPLGRSSYFICGSGEERITEPDPHLHYRPPMFPQIKTVHEENFWLSILGALALQQISGRSVYFSLAPNLDQSVIAALSEWGVVEEYAGGKRWKVTLPGDSPNEATVFPGKVELWPNVTPETLILRLQQLAVDKERYRVNRFITADVSGSDLAAAPATSLLAQMQASKLPLGADLDKYDKMREEMLRAYCNYILYFDDGVEDEDKQKRYPIIATGDEPIARGSVDEGTMIVLTASKLKSVRFDINVSTDNQTQQEKALEDQSADYDYDRKAISVKQWLKRRGFADPEKQLEEINREGSLITAQRLFAPEFEQEMRDLVSALTGLPMLPQAPLGTVPQLESQGASSVPQQTNNGAPTNSMAAPLVPGP